MLKFLTVKKCSTVSSSSHAATLAKFVIFVLLWQLLVTTTSAQVVFELEILSFQRLGHSSAQRVAGSNNTYPECKDCLTFRVCFTVYYTIIPQKVDCHLRQAERTIEGTRSLLLSPVRVDFKLPIVWPRNFSLIIEVLQSSGKLVVLITIFIFNNIS